ncbi:replication initiation protein [Spiroplasma ixodetis]|uniref:Initiator Rep protein WH1 domain-containing protein n=1 Tax=Spiroplasma ixodetis TaxID=2141 RepID=A0ABN6T1H4_9MOLU|nr:replication initiation protein [Spiroplasma ixodetis]BDT05217.1 hypothetical protein SHM_28630 [Spiroplasma ixodetis]
MAKDLVIKTDNKFIKKSNTIVRAVTNESVGILTMKLFNFAILSIKKDVKQFNGNIKFWVKDFCCFYEISGASLYEKVIHKNKEMTVIQKEIQNITQMQFLLLDEKGNKYKFINLFLEGGWDTGCIEFKVNKDLTTKYYLDLKSDYTNIYLPYTKNVTSKYSLRLYEYLRSYLYMNAKTKRVPTYIHEWDFKQLSNILNLSLNSSYFKNIGDFKKRILEPVKKDLLKTDIIFTYELIKVGRKYSKIILNTHLDLEKFNAQNPELEKVPTKKEYKTKEQENKSNWYENQSKNNIEKTILSDKQIQNILDNIDSN